MPLTETITGLLAPNPAIDEPWMDDEIYTDIDVVPLDDVPLWEGDDSALAATDGHPLEADAPPVSTGMAPEDAPERWGTKPPKRRRIVPFVRALTRGMSGHDVVAVKRALIHAKVRRPLRSTALFGPIMKRDVQKFQKLHKLTADGVYGPRTHAKLAPHFDNYGVWLLAHTHVRPKPRPDPGQTIRQKAVAAAILGYNNRWNIHYTQGWLRMQGVNQHLHPPRYPNYADCSAWVTWCYYVAGAPDPNALGYDGFGFTGTLCTHGRGVGAAQPGDLCFYGPRPSYSHVTIAISSARCISHGSESGPLLVDIRYRGDYATMRSYL